MAQVEIKEVRKSFESGKVILDSVSFGVKDGEFVSLLGPSGCGKTTMLRIVAGLETADSGSLRIDGRDVLGVSPKDRDIAMVFQNYALYPHMSVRDNIGMGLKLRGVPPSAAAPKIEDAANRLGLSELLERRPAALSGGQRQRVALARALVREPKVFLLDEPLSNLDAVLRERTRGELKLLFKRVKGTVLYVTHDQVEAMTLSDRIVVMEGGRIQQVGTPEEIYHKPANAFVATFLGAPPMNLFEQDGALRGIRPEDVEVSASPKDGWTKAAVALAEPTGATTVLTLELGERTLRAAIPGGWPGGADCWARLPSEKLHFFDLSTRLRR